MAKLIDLTGQVFDKLIVLEKAPSKNRHTMWKCKCECGAECVVSGEYLKAPILPRDCGCSKKKNIKMRQTEEKKNYLVGKKFGKLTVIQRTDKSNGSGTIWICECECGNKKEVPTCLLTSGHTQSCGCLVRETHMVDIANQKFGKLTALYPCDYKKRSSLLWHCKCDCGNECDVDGSNLRSGSTKSCGCLSCSIGELNIEVILVENNIKYKKEFCDSSFRGREGQLYRYDFAIFKDNQLNRLIEFDGEQHYSDKTGIWNHKDSLETIQARDKEKNRLAKENNIPLVRIPYWERNNITLDMIMGDQYLV